MHRSLAGLLVVALLGALGYWALSSSPTSVLPHVALDHQRPRPQGDCYVQAAAEEPDDLNLFTTTAAVARRAVLSFTHDALLDVDPATGEPKAKLAALVERDPDGVTYVLELRAGVRFSDGAPLTMADVLLTWELVGHDLPGGLWADLRLLRQVEALDDRRLRLVLHTPHWAGIARVGMAWVVAQRAHWQREVARLASVSGQPAPAEATQPAFGQLLRQAKDSGPGSGPYQLGVDAAGASLWRRGERLTLVQNPHSWRRQAAPETHNLAALELRFWRDPAALRAALRTGSVDWADDPDPQALLAAEPTLEARYQAWTYGYVTQGPTFVIWNHRRPALADRRVRQALTMLFDRQRLVQLRGARATAAASWFSPASERTPDAKPLPFDVDQARVLLAAAGFGTERPLQLEVLVPPLPDWREILELAAPDFARGGVKLDRVALDFAALRERLNRRDFDGMLYSWMPDALNDPREVFHSAGPNNWMGYAEADMDRLLDAVGAEFDPAKRAASWREFDALFARDQPVTLLFFPRSSGLLHRRFRNVKVEALGLTPTRWWVEPADQVYRFPP